MACCGSSYRAAAVVGSRSRSRSRGCFDETVITRIIIIHGSIAADCLLLLRVALCCSPLEGFQIFMAVALGYCISFNIQV